MSDTKNTIPPRDSWVEVTPGSTFRLDASVMNEWRIRAAQCRTIRGDVLARCFEIEYVLDQVIGETMIPSSENLGERRDLFDDLYLKGPGATFRSKVNVLGKLRSRFTRLQELLPANIIERLSKVRELRNDFAHYPVTFEPVGEVPNQRLRPVLVSRRGRFALEDPFLEEQAKIADSVFGDLEAAFKAMMPEAKGSSKSSAEPS